MCVKAEVAEHCTISVDELKRRIHKAFATTAHDVLRRFLHRIRGSSCAVTTADMILMRPMSKEVL
jgi:hypothetical protein